MSERWGFDLDMSAVRLMNRQDGQWKEIAVEKIDSPDIEDRLKAMIERIDISQPVELFLPREQILYANIDVPETVSRSDIETQLEGQTPYDLDDLAFDYEPTGPGKARIAAIARDTLDEAQAFAEVRNLRVAGYSSLAAPEDFPRLPDFGTVDASFDDVAPAPPEDDAPVPFASTRPPSHPPEPSIDVFKSSDPVLEVADSVPVMQVKTKAPPLDPGIPINAVPPKPRIQTDIAASSASQDVADSLTPAAGPSLIVHKPRMGALRTVAIFAIAAILTIGIATIVWSILPMSPDRTAVEPSTTPTDDPVEIAAAPESAADPEARPEPRPNVEPIEIAVPDLPIPTTSTEISALASTPLASFATTLPKPTSNSINGRSPGKQLASVQPDALPTIARNTPLPPRPETLADLITTAPSASPTPESSDPVPLDDLYVASIESPALSSDAFALASVSKLTATLPTIGSAPQPLPLETAESAAVLPGDTAEIDTSENSDDTEILAAVDPALLPETQDQSEVETEAPALITPDTQSAIEQALEDATADIEPKLRPTALAAALPSETPKPRPAGFVEKIERDKFGGRTRAQMAKERPAPRPESAQTLARAQLATADASDLAILVSAAPKNRPNGFDKIVATAIAQREAARVTAALDFEAPDTNSAVEAALGADPEPQRQRLSIPSSASVSRQATVENAIKLNRVNLVGVYGVPSDRRALIRLKSGRYVKVKIGDRVDGGTVAEITDTQLRYKKGSKLVTLALPKG